MEAINHSVNCYFCGREGDEREWPYADEYNGDDGGHICPQCLGTYNPIKVWRWENAPEEYRNLSPHGGDEDWVAYIPATFADDWIPWAESGTAFGVCDVSHHNLSEHFLGDGVVLIGAHS